MIGFARAHKLALCMVVVTIGLYVGCGLLFAHAERIPGWHGLYCAAANMATEGDCDVAPTTPLGYIVDTIEHVALVALGAVALGIFTSRLSSALVKAHVDSAAEGVKDHVETRLRHHLGKLGESHEQADPRRRRRWRWLPHRPAR